MQDGDAGAVAIYRAGETTTTCVHVDNAAVEARFGATLRGLGPKPGAVAVARVAVGAPAFQNDTGKVVVLDITAACAVSKAATVSSAIPEQGQRFGAALGQ